MPLSTLRTNTWLNDRTTALVDAKRTAEGTLFEKEATLACSSGLAAAYHDYTTRTAQKMRCIKPSSKLWWKKAKEVMKHEAQVSSVPALKSNDGEWVLDAQGKANLFAVTFAGKCKLPCLCYNSYTVCTQCHELQTSVVCPSVEQSRLASVTIAPLVLTSCLLASSNVARNSWPNLFSPCYNACQRPSLGLSLGANIVLSPSTKRKPFSQQL